MDKGFLKFKRKIRSGVIIRSALSGISLGAMVFAVQWLLAKLTNAAPDFVQFGLISGGIALAVCGVLLLLLLPSDKRLAKRLDEKLGLDEKVQTMVAFRGDSSDMAAMQREDADIILQQTPGKKARNKSAWLVAILPVVACACMVTAFLVPVNAGPNPDQPDNTSWLLNVYDRQKLLDLIEYVSTSSMQQEPKDSVVTELDELLAKLETVNKRAVMQESVISAINNIHEFTKVCDTYSAIISAMESTPSDTVKNLAKNVGSLSDLVITPYLEELTAELINPEKRTELVSVISSGIDQALANSGEDATNGLYTALADFASKLKNVTDTTTEAELSAMMKEVDASLNQAVLQPGIDAGVKKYTIHQLMSIFGISADKLSEDILKIFEENEVAGKPSKPDDDEDKEIGSAGGIGKGEQLVGSDDEIYDPDLDAYVKYGDVLQKYIAIITAYQNDGIMTPEMEEVVNEYIALLSRPQQDKDDND